MADDDGRAAAAPLAAYFAPLCVATLGADAAAAERAVADDLTNPDGALRWWLAQPAGACVVAASIDGAVAFSRRYVESERHVAVASTAALGAVLEEHADLADALEVVGSGRGASEPLARARRVLRGALAPLVAAAAEAEAAEPTSRLAAVRQRLGDLESALGRCDARASVGEATLTAPAKVADALVRTRVRFF